jgi:hypothetical protein
MTEFISHSQAGQDKFVYDTLGKSGTFLDIGCGFPIEINNTYALEQLGWRGLLVDLNHEFVEQCRRERTNPVLEHDAMAVDWPVTCNWHNLGRKIDYLSLDIDDEEGKESKMLIVLRNLLAAGLSFRVITFEHNRYFLGDSVRIPSREILLNAGYTLAVPDVANDGLEYEDWWTHD